MRRRLGLPRGLRARLIVAFLFVSALSALITAALTFNQAQSGTLERTQDSATRDLRAQAESLAPDVPFPPTAQDLRNLTLQLDRAGAARNWHSQAAYLDGKPVAGSPKAPDVPAALRSAVAARGKAVYQRYDHQGEPWLAIGVPVLFSPGGKPSGLTVYAAFSLNTEQKDIAALVTAAQAGAALALALAVVPALLAARRGLEPVRQLRTAAERITHGALDTRLDATGHDELGDLSRTFNTMAAALERDHGELRRLEAGARRFAADVSHELRTPLAAMSAVTEVLDEDAVSGRNFDAETAEAVQLISDETRKLTRVVADLMEVSRFDAGAAALHLDEVDLGEAIGKTLQLRAWMTDEVVADVPDGLRARLDPRRIDVVVANLVANALRHGDAPVRVRARTTGGGEQLVIEVSDQGPGISEDVLPHVFDRFYKGDAARIRSEGSGLGLAIALENVRLHQGTVTAANSPDGGAVFTVTLPMNPCRGSLREPQAPSAEHT